VLLNEASADAYVGTEEPVVDVSAIPGILSRLPEVLLSPFELQKIPFGKGGAWSDVDTTFPAILPVFTVESSIE
jgi:hypothetical protein